MVDHREEAAGFNNAEGNDEALRTAITRLLRRDPEEELEARRARRGLGGGGGGVIDLTQDDEDDDLGGGGGSGKGGGGGNDDVAVGVSHGDADRRRRAGPQEQRAAPEQPPPQQQPGSASAFSLLGLDRKRMEEERLARLGKRKVEQVDGDGQVPDRPAQRLRTAWRELTSALDTRKPAPPKAATPASASRPRLPFPRGVVKKTWAYGQPRQGDDIKIEEVLQKQHLQLAVLSSYQWDDDWMLTKININRTKLILVAFAANEALVSGLALIVSAMGGGGFC
jgi:hypothetical protein